MTAIIMVVTTIIYVSSLDWYERSCNSSRAGSLFRGALGNLWVRGPHPPFQFPFFLLQPLYTVKFTANLLTIHYVLIQTFKICPFFLDLFNYETFSQKLTRQSWALKGPQQDPAGPPRARGPRHLPILPIRESSPASEYRGPSENCRRFIQYIAVTQSTMLNLLGRDPANSCKKS